MANVRLDTKQINDWESFHRLCKEVFGFPDFYGMNMDAWIDCLTYINEGDGMSRFYLIKGEMLNIEISDTEDFNARLPDVFDALVECSACVNRRNVRPILSMIFL